MVLERLLAIFAEERPEALGVFERWRIERWRMAEPGEMPVE